jgi:hypothetical protein
MSPVLTFNIEGTPAWLIPQARWLGWRAKAKTDRKRGKIITTKVPVSLRTGQPCDATDSRNWFTFAQIAEILDRNAGALDGPGFALGLIEAEGEIVIGLDLDDCLDENDALAPWAKHFLAAFASYAERSPGGHGLKAFARVNLADLAEIRRLLGITETDREQARTWSFGPRPANSGHAPGVQLFLGKRYFTVTGRRWMESADDVILLTLDQIASLGKLFGPKQQRTSSRAKSSGTKSPGGKSDGADDAAEYDAEPEEAALRRKLDAAFRNNPHLKHRWEGGTEGLSDTTRSGFDMSIVAHLRGLGFSKSETRAALKLFEHGKIAEEDERYFQRMWERAAPEAESTGPQAVDPETVWDPWEEPPPPAWPGGILLPDLEQALADIAARDGTDLGAVSMNAIVAASAAAPKDTRFEAYPNSWWVPPILWAMMVGESGTRKTRYETIGWPVLREIHAGLWRAYQARLKQWYDDDDEDRGPKPAQPHSYIIDDTTPEALEIVLAGTTRGSAIIKDELAGLFEFDRYRTNPGGGAFRAFLLSAYDDASSQTHRVKRDSAFVEHTGLTIFGSIQPRRLAELQHELNKDGLLQRFLPIRITEAKLSRAGIAVGGGLATLESAIRRLCQFTGRRYTVTPAGEALMRETEQLGLDYARITDYGPAWPGFCFKLHGTHARLALVLHMLSDLQMTQIPTATVERADRLVHHFILQHGRDFYASLLGGGRDLSRDIAGWLLTRTPPGGGGEIERILASDLTAGVWACRALTSKRIGEALDPFVTGGWLVPETDYPNNRAWFFDPRLRLQFTQRGIAERERRARLRALIGTIEEKRHEPISGNS